MLEFLQTYGADILAGILAVASAVTATYNITKTLRIGKKVDTNIASTDEKIKITQDGIVEAFKTAKLPTDWKISVSNQVDKKLNAWSDKFLKEFGEIQATTTKALIFALEILSNTAAANKLTDEQKAQINDIVKLISESDATIDITE